MTDLHNVEIASFFAMTIGKVYLITLLTFLTLLTPVMKC